MNGGTRHGDYEELIDSLHAELAPCGDSWRHRAHELARDRLDRPDDFLDWAKRNHHWSFTMAELIASARARPAELAHKLLVAILGELREERGAFANGGEPAPSPY